MYRRSILLFLLIILMGFLLNLGGPSPQDFGHRIGTALAKALIPFLCLIYFIPKHKVYPKLSRSLLFAWVCLLWVLVGTYQLGVEGARFQKVRKEMDAMGQSIADGKDYEIDLEAFSKDDALILEISKKNMQFYLQVGEEWDRATYEAEYTELLRPEHLVDREFLADALIRLEKLEGQLNGIEGKYVAHTEELRSTIRSAEWETAKSQKYMVEGFENALKIIVPRLDELFTIRRQEIVELREIMRTLVDAQDWYWLEDETLVFADEDFLEAYNEHFDNMVQLEAREQALLLELQRAGGHQNPLSETAS